MKIFRLERRQIQFYLVTWLILCFLLIINIRVSAQSDSTLNTPLQTKVNSKKLKALGIGSGLLYGGVLAAAAKAWYKDIPRTHFHFFNDNTEWQQVDKVGHVWSAFHQSRLAVGALKWASVPEKKSIIWGSLTGVILQTPIEILDGYGVDYGASVGDLVANAVGSAAVLSQFLFWSELRLQPKFSFHQTRFAKERPAVLGSNLPEQLLKDYNGQTYWLALDIAKFLAPTSRYPKWLNVAVGYGTEEMVFNDPDTNKQAGFRAYRQFYLAPDINLTAIKTQNKFLKTAFFILDMVHLPLPALEFNGRQKFKFNPLYF
ncbi:MAG: YfiM family protein [Bacteroidota bacterium]|nr:YfiM family protein [Bacteroidota bacterium]